ncbi:hypothetical protein BU16DRAFT_554172 [Lophium mytilinum]|uniref:Uncharacterized protein n=1 Tax=Lophium mytilinum TaxID=390894 RepID=A0A6A6RCJ0_9PEZI|nr:hypothetical protein BU16DRAFT_554172 [Lophium mytilinum]
MKPGVSTLLNHNYYGSNTSRLLFLCPPQSHPIQHVRWGGISDSVMTLPSCGTVILKRYEDAIADNDNILGCILGAATKHSGEACASATWIRSRRSSKRVPATDFAVIDLSDLDELRLQADDLDPGLAARILLNPDRIIEFFDLEVNVPDKAKVKEMLTATETLVSVLEHHPELENQKRSKAGRIYYCWHLARGTHQRVEDLENHQNPSPFNLTHVAVSSFIGLWYLIDKQPDVLRTKANDTDETIVPFGDAVHSAAKECYALVQRWIVE